MDESTDSLEDARVFSTLNANSSYWKKRDEEDGDKMTFTSHHQRLGLTNMQYGLKEAPSALKRGVDVMFATVKKQFALVYFDDIIIFSKSRLEDAKHVSQILHILSDAGVRVKLKKRSLFTKSIDYLGHIICCSKLEISRRTFNTTYDLKVPPDATGTRYFLGLCNAFRQATSTFARIARLLSKEIHKNQP